MINELINAFENRVKQLQAERERLVGNINAYNGAIEELTRQLNELKRKCEDEGSEKGTDDNDNGNPAV